MLALHPRQQDCRACRGEGERSNLMKDWTSVASRSAADLVYVQLLRITNAKENGYARPRVRHGRKRIRRISRHRRAHHAQLFGERAVAPALAANEGDALRIVPGDLFDAAALDEGMRGCDAIIHLVRHHHGEARPGDHVSADSRRGERATSSMRRCAAASGDMCTCRRWGHAPGADSTYHRTKYAAEEYVRASGLEWTIIRPSLIHGPHGEFMGMEAKWARFSAPPFLSCHTSARGRWALVARECFNRFT
jgi:uncharacterized protein YbjT (DUF2867 family)